MQHIGGTYSFPKGHIEPGETAEIAAQREVVEETGYTNLEVIKPLGNIYRSHKTIAMFEIKLLDDTRNTVIEEVAEWITIDRAIQRMRYDEDKEFLKTWLKLHTS